MEKIALELTNVTKRYQDFTLNDISFKVPQGSIVGLIGENGAGKSTTINCILNELRIDEGEILIFGRDHADEESYIKDKLGVVFDENHFPDIFTPVEIGACMAGVYAKWSEEVFFGYLEAFNLPKDKRIKDFSKGMKVKLAFAVALSHEAELLLLDEATSGLDPVIREEILDILLDFVQDERHSVLVSSHIISDLEKVADYIVFIHRGELVFGCEKDLLVDRYGVVVCGGALFDQLDEEQIIACRREDYQYRVLVKDRHAAAKAFPKAIVRPASIEEIMLLYVKGEIR